LWSSNLDALENMNDSTDLVIKVYVYFLVYGNIESSFMALVRNSIKSTDTEVEAAADTVKMPLAMAQDIVKCKTDEDAYDF
jgi:hypothetical protein